MSSRQMRRLQRLVASSTGADGDADEEEMMPSTMKPAKSRKHKKPTTAGETLADADDAAEQVEHSRRAQTSRAAASSLTTPSATADADAPLTSPSSKTAKTAVDAVLPAGPSPEEKAAQKKERKKAAKARRQQVEAEEEALLDAALERAEGSDAHSPAPASDATGDGVGAAGADDSTGAASASDLIALLTVADAARLDMRLERIRNFGQEAVEDVGDGTGPRHRADGRTRDTGSTSFFPEHGGKVKFRTCALATPNRYRWPPYDSLGVAVKVLEDPPFLPADGSAPAFACMVDYAPRKALCYALDIDSAAFHRAEDALEQVVAQHGSINELIQCMAQYGVYHLPLLLQASQTLELMGNAAHAQEFMDLALYSVGMTLSHFPMAGSWSRRMMPACIEENRLLFLVLIRGMHVALHRGCARTAWELGKFIYSLDPLDPYGMLLQLDYAALRAKRWVWLIHVYLLAKEKVKAASPELVRQLLSGERRSDERAEQYTALTMLLIPNFAFNAALAKHLLERELTREAEAAGTEGRGSRRAGGSGSPKPKYRSKVLRDMSTAEEHMLETAPTSEAMLAEAMVMHPCAAVQLVDALLGVSTVCRGAVVDPFWASTIEPEAARQQIQGASAQLIASLAQCFAKRSSDMWKPTETVALLRSVLTHGGNGSAAGEPGLLSVAAESVRELRVRCYEGIVATDDSAFKAKREHLIAVLCGQYGSIQAEDVVGSPATAIPADLLAPEAPGEEDILHDARLRLPEALNEVERDLLLRFVALYGPLDPQEFRSDRDRLQNYRRQFEQEDLVRQLHEDESPIAVFFRTLMPWNSTEEMTLRQVLANRGIADPLYVRQQQERAVDHATWAREAVEAEAEEDESDWVSVPSMGSTDGDED